jgi:hypothetical protein
VTELKKNCVALLLMVGMSGAMWAQQQTPKVVEQAAQCLAAKKLISVSAATPLNFGYVIDTKSVPGKKVLYLVATPVSNRSAGRAFAIFFRERRRRPIIDIQNGATFLRSGDGPQGVGFVVPPAGGTAAEPPFVDAIQQIEGQPMISIAGTILQGAPKHLQCDAYTDSFPE